MRTSVNFGVDPDGRVDAVSTRRSSPRSWAVPVWPSSLAAFPEHWAALLWFIVVFPSVSSRCPHTALSCHPARVSRCRVGFLSWWIRSHIPAQVTAVSYTAGTEVFEVAINATSSRGSRWRQSPQVPQSPRHSVTGLVAGLTAGTARAGGYPASGVRRSPRPRTRRGSMKIVLPGFVELPTRRPSFGFPPCRHPASATPSHNITNLHSVVFTVNGSGETEIDRTDHNPLRIQPGILPVSHQSPGPRTPTLPPGPAHPSAPGPLFRVIRRGAPGGSRTHTGALLRDLPLPVGLRGHPPRVSCATHRDRDDQEQDDVHGRSLRV